MSKFYHASVIVHRKDGLPAVHGILRADPRRSNWTNVYIDDMPRLINNDTITDIEVVAYVGAEPAADDGESAALEIESEQN